MSLDPKAVIDRMNGIDGWFYEEEGVALLEYALKALRELKSRRIVEVGSYRGKSTSVLGAAAKEVPGSLVYAIDPHEGVVTIAPGEPPLGRTLEEFVRNMRDAGVSDVIVVLEKKSCEVVMDDPISLLFIDGLHDYGNVSFDFGRFARLVEPGGYVLFHDRGYPDVARVIGEALATGRYADEAKVESLQVLRKR